MENDTYTTISIHSLAYNVDSALLINKTEGI